MTTLTFMATVCFVYLLLKVFATPIVDAILDAFERKQ